MPDDGYVCLQWCVRDRLQCGQGQHQDRPGTLRHDRQRLRWHGGRNQEFAWYQRDVLRPTCRHEDLGYTLDLQLRGKPPERKQHHIRHRQWISNQRTCGDHAGQDESVFRAKPASLVQRDTHRSRANVRRHGRVHLRHLRLEIRLSGHNTLLVGLQHPHSCKLWSRCCAYGYEVLQLGTLRLQFRHRRRPRWAFAHSIWSFAKLLGGLVRAPGQSHHRRQDLRHHWQPPRVCQRHVGCPDSLPAHGRLVPNRSEWWNLHVHVRLDNQHLLPALRHRLPLLLRGRSPLTLPPGRRVPRRPFPAKPSLFAFASHDTRER